LTPVRVLDTATRETARADKPPVAPETEQSTLSRARADKPPVAPETEQSTLSRARADKPPVAPETECHREYHGPVDGRYFGCVLT